MNEPVPTTPRVPVRLVLLSIAGLWLCYFVVATIRSAVMGLDFGWEIVSRRIVVTCASMLVTAALWPLLQAMARRLFWEKALVVSLVALPGSLALGAINHFVFASMDEMAEENAGTTIRSGDVTIRKDRSGDIFIDVPEAPAPPGPVPVPKPPAPPLSDEPAAAAPTSPAVSIKQHDGKEKGTLADLVELAFGRYFLLLAWAAIYLALANAEQARAAERREGEFRRAAQVAELRSLRYQINPHFLFNTLNSLSALVLTGRAESAERMIQTLSAFYRRSLVDDSTEDVALAEEIALQRLYLDIEAVRFPDRLRTRIDVPDALAEVLVPGMILQPLIENSVKYGVAATTRPVTIAIDAAAEDDYLLIAVSDDGPGPKPAFGADGCGIGLANVRDRLQARFGEDARLDAGPRPEGGYRGVIRLPLRRRQG